MRWDTRRYILTGLVILFGLPIAAGAQETQATSPVPARATKPATKPRSVTKSGAKLVVTHPKTAPTAPAKADEPVITVTVRANSDVLGRTFKLGEIADITGSDKALAAQLAAVEIGTAPLPGLSRLLYPGDIIVHLRANHLDSKRVLVIAPPTLRVTSLGADVPAEQIVKAALAAGQDAIKKMPDATLEAVPIRGKITVPSGKTQFLAGTWRGEPEQGLFYVPVSILVDNKPSQTIEVALRVRRKTSVLVTVRPVAARAILTADDVVLAPIDLPAGFTQPLTEAAQAIGKRALRPLPANAPLSANLLETPPAIQVNDKILIEYVNGVIHISAPGVARQSGAVGETIRVYASDTKKEMDAIIVDAHTVRITSGDSTGDGGEEPKKESK